MNNPNNILITKEDVEGILNFFGPIGDNNQELRIGTLDYYQRAFTQESYHQSVQTFLHNPENMPVYLNYISKESNEVQEYLGDHILKAVLGRYLFERFGSFTREGFLTKLKIKIEKCSMLHQFAVTLGFKKFLLLSLQIENQTLLDINRGRNTPSYYEDAFESFLGSIMEDFGEKGYIYADRFIRNIIENVIDFSELISVNQNHKDSLQRFFQSNKFKTPTYQNVVEEGPLYRRVFTKMLIITKEQLNDLDPLQKRNIAKYTQECLDFYKTKHPETFSKLFERVSSGNSILCVGSGRRVVESEQNCAKIGLRILNLDDDF